MQKLRGTIRDQRRLLGRFCNHGVARGQSGGDLPCEDRQRKIPRTDANEDTAPAQTQRIKFSGRARHHFGLAELRAGLSGVVA